MSERIHVLAHQIFGKSSVEECDLSEIRDLVNRHPYFAPAQFLLLAKLKQENDPGYQAQLQKSVLYYHNPLEFEFFINSERFYTDESILLEEHKETTDLNALHIDNPTQTEEQLETTQISVNDPAEGFLNTENDIQVEIPTQTETLETTELHVKNSQIETNDLDTELLNAEKDAVSNDASYSSEEVIFIAEENMNKDEENEDEVSIEIEPDEEQTEFKMRAVPSDLKSLVTEIQTSNPLTVVPKDSESTEGDQPATTNPESESLSFEPFHTVDYFASQGIKLSQEEVPKDKFGKQLKSFTEWLKTMKRLPSKEIAIPADPNTEQKVQHLAEDSVHEAEIVTEAMAEVWLKQGNRQKALETYNKLSLQNPSKSAYFATLIENLKRS